MAKFLHKSELCFIWTWEQIQLNLHQARVSGSRHSNEQAAGRHVRVSLVSGAFCLRGGGEKLECSYTGVRSHKVVALVSSLSIEID